MKGSGGVRCDQQCWVVEGMNLAASRRKVSFRLGRCWKLCFWQGCYVLLHPPCLLSSDNIVQYFTDMGISLAGCKPCVCISVEMCLFGTFHSKSTSQSDQTTQSLPLPVRELLTALTPLSCWTFFPVSEGKHFNDPKGFSLALDQAVIFSDNSRKQLMNASVRINQSHRNQESAVKIACAWT